MLPELSSSPLYFALLGLLCGVVGFRAAWRIGVPWLLPLVQGGMGFLAFAVTWRARGALLATLAVAGWAVGSTLISLSLFRRQPEQVDRRVLRAAAYRKSMLSWLRTGQGPESTPRQTARQHLYELAFYIAAAVTSANLLSLIMGAVLLNYMNAYVAVLLLSARKSGTVRLLAWNSWSLIRVAAYVMLGSACAEPLARWWGYAADPRAIHTLLVLGFGGVVADLLLKLVLSRSCGARLAAAVDLELAEAFPGTTTDEGT